MNRIIKSFKGKKKLLSIYFTAGFPNVDDTVDIIPVSYTHLRAHEDLSTSRMPSSA